MHAQCLLVQFMLLLLFYELLKKKFTNNKFIRATIVINNQSCKERNEKLQLKIFILHNFHFQFNLFPLF